MSTAMLRAMLVASLAALALVGGGCETDACRGVDGTCIALTVTGPGQVDGVEIALSGAASGTRVAPPTATLTSLPIEVGLALANAPSGTVHVDVVGLLLGGFAGSGSTDVTIGAGEHKSATVALAAGGGSLGGDGGVALPFDVSGTRVRHYVVGDGGVTDVPTDFTGTPISAFVEDADGGITTVAGSGDANGNFKIVHVPSAPYTLHFESTYVVGSARHPDLGSFILGRADQKPATSRTTLSFSVSGATAWAAGDTLEFFSPNAGTAVFGVENFLAPMAGTTQLSGSFDLSQMLLGNLIDSTKGDDAFLVQLVADSNSGVAYDRLAKIARFSPFTVNDGGSASLSAAMTDVAQSESLSIAWSRSQFAQYRAAVSAAATTSADSFNVFAQPGGLEHGMFSSTPDVLVVNAAAGTSDVSLTASYGNPYPTSWPLIAAAVSYVPASYTAAGATAQSFNGAIFAAAPLASAPSPFGPVVTPVQNATVDGQPASIGQPSLATTPLIAWDPPAVGSPSSYAVRIFGIDNVAGATSLDPVATIYTLGQSVTVPPGMLVGGQRYFVDIIAYADGIDRSVTPLAQAFPAGYADALSGPLVVDLVAEAASCKDLLALHPGLPDGVYTIDVDGSGAAPPTPVYCDMTSDGGGWTLCAWAVSASAASPTWAPPASAQSSNWYACQKYSATPVEARVRLANSTTTYTNQYTNVDFRPSIADTMYTPTPSAAPNFSLTLTPNEGGCNQPSTGNLQWTIGTMTSIYGLTPKTTCGSGSPGIFIRSPGVHINGCSLANQIPPEIGFPCGGYGDFGVHLELWAR